MATKREVMLAGIPAKLAHMLASDEVGDIVAPTGTTQADALLVQRNLTICQGVDGDIDGRGLRLRPASGQFIHVIRCVGPNTIKIWADSDEVFNGRSPGVSWPLGPGETGLFVPSKRQWLAGNMLGPPAVINGPVSIGGPQAPADAASSGDLFVQDVLTIALGERAGVPQPAGRLAFNAYLDTTGTWRYLEDGAAGLWRFDGTDGSITYNQGAAGLAGQPIPGWTGLTNPLFRVGLPGTSNGSRLMGPVGLGRDAPLDALVGQIFVQQMLTVALSMRPSTSGVHGRFTFNAYWDNAGGWRYLDNGPALLMRYDSTTGELAILTAAGGTADTPITGFGDPTIPNVGFLPRSGIVSGQTTLRLSTNEAGTVLTQQVLVGPAGSGPGGSGRALYVAT